MKTFVSTAFVVASAALASAQSSAVFNSATNSFSCPIANGTYCVGTSNIIIRCANGVGFPGNCNDNLAGEPPLGLFPAQCYTSPTVAGEAACAKNCIVYGGSGNINGTFSIPGCSSISTTTSSVSAFITASSNLTATATSTVVIPPISITTISPIIVVPSISVTTIVPLGTGFAVVPSGAVGTGGAGGSANGTAPGNGASSAPGGGTATATPVGPSKTTIATGPASFTGAAATNVAAAGFAAAGLLVAALL